MKIDGVAPDVAEVDATIAIPRALTWKLSVCETREKLNENKFIFRRVDSLIYNY